MSFSFFKGIKPLTCKGALRDSLAGLSLASMNIPQLLGYARIAGMPPVAGLYAGFLPLIVFAIFGSSRHLVVAADSATATIFSSHLSGIAAESSPEYIALAGMTALFTALFLLLARIFRFGFLADFLSSTVLVGFLSGVGVQIGIAMLPDMLGISVASRNTVEQASVILRQLFSLQSETLLVSALVVGIILIFKTWKPRWPVALMIVVASIIVSASTDFAGHGIAIIGPVAGGLPELRWPAVSWRQALDLLPVAASCFVIIIAQSAATSRAFAERYGERVDENANLLGLSAANFTAGLSGAFVVNGSPTQTAMGDNVGARSQFAQLVFSGVVIVVLLFLCRWLQYLPHCVLAGIVFTIAVRLINVRTMLAIRRESPGEFRLAMATALAVIFIGVGNGIMLAIALSLLRHVRHSYRPNSTVLVQDDEGHHLPVPAESGLQTAPGLIVFRFNADLFYANDHYFCDEVRRLIKHAPAPVRCFIVDAGAMTDLDYSAGRTVNDLCKELAEKQIRIIFGRVSNFLRADMDRHGITPVIGVRNIYPTLHQAFEQFPLKTERRP